MQRVKASVTRRNHVSVHMSIEAEYGIIRVCAERKLVITLIVGRKILINYR